MLGDVGGWSERAFGERGVTLLELLVVLAIVAAVVGLVAPALIVRPRPPDPPIVGFLERQRTRAVVSRREVVVLHRDGVLTPDLGGEDFSLGTGRSLRLIWPEPSSLMPQQRVAMFFPDGTSIASRIAVAQRSGEGQVDEIYRIFINPFNGEVDVVYP